MDQVTMMEPFQAPSLANSHEATKRKAGKPSLEWTPSQERMLFKLVEKGILWKDIPDAMREAAADGKPEWAPCLSTCRKRFYDMSGMYPSDVPLQDRTKKKKQEERLKRAFERYLERQSQMIPADVTAIEPMSFASGSISYASQTNASLSTDLSQEGSSASRTSVVLDVNSVPSLITSGISPPDSTRALGTPNSQYQDDQPVIISSQSPFWIPPEPSTNIDIQTLKVVPNQNKSERLIRLPSDIYGGLITTDQSQPSTTARHEKHHQNQTQIAPSAGGKEALDSLNHLPMTMKKRYTRVTDDRSKNAQPTRQNRGYLEDQMKEKRGFIDFIKHSLTASRDSVQSMISSTGSIRSRFSSRRSSRISSQASFDQSYLYNSNMPNQSDRPASELLSGRKETTLFLQLRLAGDTDDEIATRLKVLLDGLGIDEAKNLVNYRNVQGETPLQVALELGNVPACEVLMNAGANVYAKSSDGKSLSEFGRLAQNRATSTSQFCTIGACRTKILDFSPNSKSKGKSRSRKRAAPQDSGTHEPKKTMRDMLQPRPLSRNSQLLGPSQLQRSLFSGSRSLHPSCAGPDIPSHMGADDAAPSQALGTAMQHNLSFSRPKDPDHLSFSRPHSLAPTSSSMVSAHREHYESLSSVPNIARMKFSPTAETPPPTNPRSGSVIFDSYFANNNVGNREILLYRNAMAFQQQSHPHTSGEASFSSGGLPNSIAEVVNYMGGYYETLPDGRQAFILTSAMPATTPNMESLQEGIVTPAPIPSHHLPIDQSLSFQPMNLGPQGQSIARGSPQAGRETDSWIDEPNTFTGELFGSPITLPSSNNFNSFQNSNSSSYWDGVRAALSSSNPSGHQFNTSNINQESIFGAPQYDANSMPSEFVASNSAGPVQNDYIDTYVDAQQLFHDWDWINNRP